MASSNFKPAFLFYHMNARKRCSSHLRLPFATINKVLDVAVIQADIARISCFRVYGTTYRFSLNYS
jgi:hypothetical protein